MLRARWIRNILAAVAIMSPGHDSDGRTPSSAIVQLPYTSYTSHEIDTSNEMNNLNM